MWWGFDPLKESEKSDKEAASYARELLQLLDLLTNLCHVINPQPKPTQGPISLDLMESLRGVDIHAEQMEQELGPSQVSPIPSLSLLTDGACLLPTIETLGAGVVGLEQALHKENIAKSAYDETMAHLATARVEEKVHLDLMSAHRAATDHHESLFRIETQANGATTKAHEADTSSMELVKGIVTHLDKLLEAAAMDPGLTQATLPTRGIVAQFATSPLSAQTAAQMVTALGDLYDKISTRAEVPEWWNNNVTPLAKGLIERGRCNEIFQANVADLLRRKNELEALTAGVMLGQMDGERLVNTERALLKASGNINRLTSEGTARGTELETAKNLVDTSQASLDNALRNLAQPISQLKDDAAKALVEAGKSLTAIWSLTTARYDIPLFFPPLSFQLSALAHDPLSALSGLITSITTVRG